ncbi:MAG: hypothetical protein AD742_16585 [Methylibium sp. NZG]|nr:MAG: hypothetical protein AD742_16585 [Methylibium sp. NZG]
MNHWTTLLMQRALAAPVRPRVPLRLASGGPRIGSLETALAQQLQSAGLPLRPAQGPSAGWWLDGAADKALAEIAAWLHAQGLGGRWRNELLAVTGADAADSVSTPESDRAVAAIERAAVRPLGVATFAVHLVARTAAGEVWVQQRALDKATDPGLWDTTMGGLRAADETVLDTLARETWEEAGLRLDALHGVQAQGRISVRRPVVDGYMVEHTDIFEATLRDGSVPVNQDGEVAAFERLQPAALRRRLQHGQFTLEAALVLLKCMPELGSSATG